MMSKLDVAKKICLKMNELNDGFDFIICGSLAIMELLPDIDLNRNPHDIDIELVDKNKSLTISNWTNKIKFPEDVHLVSIYPVGCSKYIGRIVFRYQFENVDLFIKHNATRYQVKDGFKFVDIDDILKNKFKWKRPKDLADIELVKNRMGWN